MTTDEIEALAKRLEEVKPHDNVPFTCYRGAAALRHLMARVSEFERERDIAFNEGLELAMAAASKWAAIYQIAAMKFEPDSASRDRNNARSNVCLELRDAIHCVKRPQEAT